MDNETPDWATHIAKSKVNGREEFCAWLPEVGDYVDQDPRKLKANDWAGSYKHRYWEFKPVNNA